MSKATLVWRCKTAEGWQRYPAVYGKNNRLKQGFALVDGREVHIPEGTYQIRQYVDRKTVYVPAGDLAVDALAKLKMTGQAIVAKAAAAEAGLTVVDGPTRVFLTVAAKQFEEDAKHREALEAAEVNRLTVAEFISVTGKTYTDEVVKTDVYKFHKALRDRGCADRTVSNKHLRLKSFFRFAGMDYKTILPPTPKYDKKMPVIYTTEQIDAIRKVANDYMLLVINLGYMCGLREQEIVHLEWSDIHWTDSYLRVVSKPHYKFKVKDSEERDIPIAITLLEQLKKRRELFPDSKLVLPSKSGKPNRKLLRLLKRMAKDNGLNCGNCEGCESTLQECQQWQLHKLRRTFATTLLRNGADLATVQKFMGHSDLESTMRYLQAASSTASQNLFNSVFA
jgi:integrase